MSGPYRPFDPGFVNGVQVHPDVAHGPYPEHLDVRVRLDEGLCHKFRVGGTDNILDEEIEVGRRFLKGTDY